MRKNKVFTNYARFQDLKNSMKSLLTVSCFDCGDFPASLVTWSQLSSLSRNKSLTDNRCVVELPTHSDACEHPCRCSPLSRPGSLCPGLQWILQSSLAMTFCSWRSSWRLLGSARLWSRQSAISHNRSVFVSPFHGLDDFQNIHLHQKYLLSISYRTSDS